jgi:hypothetical protein
MLHESAEQISILSMLPVRRPLGNDCSDDEEGKGSSSCGAKNVNRDGI